MKKQFILSGLLLGVLTMGLSSCVDKILGDSPISVEVDFKNNTDDTIVFYQKSTINIGFTDTVKIAPYKMGICHYGYKNGTSDMAFNQFIVTYIDLFYFRKGTKVIQDGKTFSSHPNYTVEKFIYQKESSVIYTVTLDNQFFQ